MTKKRSASSVDKFLSGDVPTPAPGTHLAQQVPAGVSSSDGRTAPTGAENGEGLVTSPDPTGGGVTGGPAPTEQEWFTAETVTPSGVGIRYEAGPKRRYLLRSPERPDGSHNFDWFEVPSNTTILDVLEKGGLTWWGQGIGALGALELQQRGVDLSGVAELLAAGNKDAARKAICDLLTAEKISVNHIRDAAGDRGTSVHNALEQWGTHGIVPVPDVYPETEQPYVHALLGFLLDAPFVCQEVETMVGSLQHRFAGRFDMLATLHQDTEVVVHHTPVKGDVRKVVPAGTYLLDCKTSSGVYTKHFLQNEGYEGARVECGYPASDYRAIVHLNNEGKHRLVLNPGYTFDDFLAVRRVYDVMNRKFPK